MSGVELLILGLTIGQTICAIWQVRLASLGQAIAIPDRAASEDVKSTEA